MEAKPLTNEELKALWTEMENNPWRRFKATIESRDREIAELKAKLKRAELSIDNSSQERDAAIQLIDHLGSWKDKDRHCYDLTNPEAQVQPIIDKLDAAIQSLNNITHIKDELALELKAANAKDAIQRAERLEKQRDALEAEMNPEDVGRVYHNLEALAPTQEKK